MTQPGRARVLVVTECLLAGIALGALLGVLWWLLAPTASWQVLTGGTLVPAAPGHDDWFAADGWFLGLGLVLGVGLTALVWSRSRQQPAVAAGGVAVGACLLSITGWALGRVLGPADPMTQVGSVPTGEVLPGVLSVDAPAVLLAPVLGALGLLLMLLASAAVTPAETGAEPSPVLAPPSGG